MRIVVWCLEHSLLPKAKQLASSLNVPLLLTFDRSNYDLALQLSNHGLQLVWYVDNKQLTLKISFTDGKNRHRLNYGGGKSQMLAKACGLNKTLPTILDVTAGLGADAFVLASLGCTVTMCERNNLLVILLEDALERAKSNAETAVIVSKMRLINIEATTLLANWRKFLAEKPQVIYLDPMFPVRSKTALVKKNMQVLQMLNAKFTSNDDLLLNLALDVAQNRVVVKRPKSALSLTKLKPSYSLFGKSSRFDIYTKNKL